MDDPHITANSSDDIMTFLTFKLFLVHFLHHHTTIRCGNDHNIEAVAVSHALLARTTQSFLDHWPVLSLAPDTDASLPHSSPINRGLYFIVPPPTSPFDRRPSYIGYHQLSHFTLPDHPRHPQHNRLMAFTDKNQPGNPIELNPATTSYLAALPPAPTSHPLWSSPLAHPGTNTIPSRPDLKFPFRPEHNSFTLHQANILQM